MTGSIVTAGPLSLAASTLEIPFRDPFRIARALDGIGAVTVIAEVADADLPRGPSTSGEAAGTEGIGGARRTGACNLGHRFVLCRHRMHADNRNVRSADRGDGP